MMWALDFTLNSVTMLALVLMVGIVIDDAIVVLENIFRFVEEKSMNSFEAARAATAEIGMAVMATTFSLVVIFVPVAFMSSISGRFLYQFGLTAAVAVLVSLSGFVYADADDERAHAARRGRGNRREAKPIRGKDFTAGSTVTTSACCSGPWRTASRSCYSPHSWCSRRFRSIRWFNRNIFPATWMKPSSTSTSPRPQGISLAAMDEIMRAVENELRAIPLVRLMLCDAGGGFISGVGTGGCYVRIAPHDERIFSFSRLWRETLNGQPWVAFQQHFAARRDAAGSRAV